MNHQEISKLSPEAINEAVARRLGWKLCDDDPLPGVKEWHSPGDERGIGVCTTVLPDYCHSFDAAWEIWEKLSDLNYDLQLYSSWDRRNIVCFHATEKTVRVNEYPPRQLHGEADTAPVAICLAFLKLPEGEDK